VQNLASLSLALALLLTACSSSRAQGEHARRVAAELLVMQGDARKLLQLPAPTKLHRIGLEDRLRGGLAGLAILLRLADQELARKPPGSRSIVNKARAALQHNDLLRFKKIISELIARYPLASTGILPAGATAQRLKTARQLHETICAGCHDEPDTEVPRPAYNLSTEARTMPPAEFAARMILGLRGDRITGIANPLSDEEIAALIAYYKTSPPQ